jgi:hypothetical protein
VRQISGESRELGEERKKNESPVFPHGSPSGNTRETSAPLLFPREFLNENLSLCSLLPFCSHHSDCVPAFPHGRMSGKHTRDQVFPFRSRHSDRVPHGNAGNT